jgi:soluble lytic murein transglycosylase-like protein
MPLFSRSLTATQAARAALLAIASLGCGAATAQIYSGRAEASASVVLSNFRSDDAPELLIANPSPPAAASTPGVAASEKDRPRGTRTGVVPVELRRVIDEVAAQVSIAPELLHAVIAAESAYDVRALSPKGAVGLMQLLPATGRRFGAKDLYSPKENVLAGASYLKWLMARFDNDLELVLAAYNAGEQAVLKAGLRIPPYAETQAYVPKVLSYLRCKAPKACKLV